MGWAIGSIPCPPEWEGEMMQTMRRVDFALATPGSQPGA